MEVLLNRFKGEMNFDEAYEWLDEIENDVPSIGEYLCEAHELILHFSDIKWKILIFEWKDKKYKFNGKEIVKDYSSMYQLLINLN